MDTYFAVACVILLAGLVWAVMYAKREIAWAMAGWRRASALCDEAKRDACAWQAAYQLRDAQLDEARNRIDTLEGELTAADLSLAQARAQVAPFDHDGNGAPGGSLKRA